MFALILIRWIVIYPVDSAIAEPGGQATILNKQMENLVSPTPTPTPQIKNGKMVRFCPSRGFILDFERRGGLGVAVPFILSKVVGPQSLI